MKRAKANIEEKEAMKIWLAMQPSKRGVTCPFAYPNSSHKCECYKFFPTLPDLSCPCTRFLPGYTERVFKQLIKE